MADYIRRRDGGVEADWRNVMLCAGASEVSRVQFRYLDNRYIYAGYLDIYYNCDMHLRRVSARC